MIYKVIAFFLISGLAGIKRPIYGGIAGLITAPVINIIFNCFDLPTVFVLAAFGFGFGLMWRTFAWNLFHADSLKLAGELHVWRHYETFSR